MYCELPILRLSQSAASIILIAATQLYAQPPKNASSVSLDVVVIEKSGTVKKVSPESIEVETKGGTYIADLKRTFFADFEQQTISTPPAQIRFDWTEKHTALRPGMIVRFEIELQRDKAKNLVSEVTVINRIPPPKLEALVIHDLDGKAKAEPEGRRTSGERHQVTGRLKLFKGRLLAVEYPGRIKPLQATVTRDAVVKIEDITFARPGDHVEVKGEQVSDSTEPRFWATQILVKREGKGGGGSKSDLAAKSTSAASAATNPEGTPDKKPVEYRGKIIKIN